MTVHDFHLMYSLILDKGTTSGLPFRILRYFYGEGKAVMYYFLIGCNMVSHKEGNLERCTFIQKPALLLLPPISVTAPLRVTLLGFQAKNM